jgi:TolB-like protein/cytochrome c-type biogenesis protein CcmH/NrfG
VQSLLRGIQQRKIDRVAAAYAVAAWLVVQGASIVLPTFGAPLWVLKVLIVAAIAGFPLTLWIAWHLTPVPHHRRHGPPPPLTAGDMALLVLLAGVMVVSAAEIAGQSGLLPGLSKTAPSMRAGSPTSDSSPPRTSIAVLPFANMSGDASKEYFSDGISEELLNQLANAPDLRVAARTSSFAFKGKEEDIRSIARALNVASVLEGSVREDGRHIRITAELINAADGFQLWSKTFDRDLSNILEVQDEIARAITASLTHGVLGTGSRNPAPARPPIDPEAYRQYLEAQSLSARKTPEDDAKAVALFQQVTKTEPEFAPGFAALGRTYVHMAQFQNQRPDLIAAADAALNQALKRDPRNLEALSSHLLVALMQWRWQDAAADARKLEALNPHSVFTLRGLDSYYDSLGFPEQQAAALREATRLDPLSFVDLNNLASAYNNRGDYAEAESAANDALALRPDRVLTIYTLCSAYAGMKRANRAQILIDRLAALQAPDASQGCAALNAVASGRPAEAHALVDAIARRFPSFVFDETDIGSFYFAAGDTTNALTWFNRAYDKRDYHLFAIAYLATTSPALLKTPGWIALKQKPEAKAWQAAHDQLAAELTGD